MPRLRLVTLGIAILSCLAPSGAKAQGSSSPNAVTLRFDYGGAEALLAAIERRVLTDADVDSLLRIHGVRAMIDNVTRFVPGEAVPQFRGDVQAFARSKRSNRASPFQLEDVWRRRKATRPLLQQVRSREAEIAGRAIARLKRYPLATGPLAVTVYFVVGGVSDGFVFDDRFAPAFYINLTRSGDDFDGLVENLAHETFHVMQKAAQRRVPGLAVYADSSERQAPPLRLLTTTLAEGLANYAVDPQRSSASGEQSDASRKRYHRNAQPERIAENFRLFDQVLRDLRAGRMSWEDAYRAGFSGNNDARFYFVGYQMAKAIEQHCGTACIGNLFERPPVEFFRQYIQLYRIHSAIPGRFAPETEAFLLSEQGGRSSRP